MGNKNKFRNENINVNENIVDVQITPETSSIDNEVITAGYAEVIEEPKKGKVNTVRLNLRAEASTDSAVLCVLTEGTEVDVKEDESFGDFYGVTYKSEETDIIGFCLKEYITIL